MERMGVDRRDRILASSRSATYLAQRHWFWGLDTYRSWCLWELIDPSTKKELIHLQKRSMIYLPTLIVQEADFWRIWGDAMSWHGQKLLVQNKKDNKKNTIQQLIVDFVVHFFGGLCWLSLVFHCHIPVLERATEINFQATVDWFPNNYGPPNYPHQSHPQTRFE